MIGIAAEAKGRGVVAIKVGSEREGEGERVKKGTCSP